MGETCDICGREKEDCGACGDWSMGGEAYEYERAQLKCYSIGFKRLRDLYREWQEEVDRARAALRERDAQLLDLLRDMLPMATRAWHDDMPQAGCAGARDDGRSLTDSLRFAREGALLSRVRALLEEAGK